MESRCQEGWCMVETGGQRVGPGKDFSGAQRHLEEHREMVMMESRAMGWGWLMQGFAEALH